MTATDREAGRLEFEEHGFIVLRGPFSPAEIQRVQEEFTALQAAGPIPGHFEPRESDTAGLDPLNAYPRVMHPHLISELALRYLLEPRLRTVLETLLFFNGSLVHGSQPNRSAGRFRRSLICHYVGRSAQRIGQWYPTLSMTGDRVRLPGSEGAGPCGTEFRAGRPPLTGLTHQCRASKVG
jgi:hypothetical protein